MSKTYKPDWNNDVSPYLTVDSVEDQIKFLHNVFGAEVIEAPKQPDGKVFHAEVRIGDSIVMIGLSQKDWPALKSNVHVYVPDVNEVYKLALNNGAKTLTEPADMFYGNREAGFADPEGTNWWIAQLLKPMTEQEITKEHPGKS